MYLKQKVSLILPTYNERYSIRKVINDFEALKIIDEILVVNNNAVKGTSEEVAKTSAIEIHEPIQGYGVAIRRGFKETTGDLIVVCEPDGTFVADDVHKLLAYSNNVDIVYGSRTIDAFIWENANMRGFIRLGNWAVAKLIEVLFNTHYLSDVGCTYRLIKRRALKKIKPEFQVKANLFGPEMMIRGLQKKIPSVQIPVNYKPRVGQSSVTGYPHLVVILGLQMVIMILAFRLGLESWVIPLVDRPFRLPPRKRKKLAH